MNSKELCMEWVSWAAEPDLLSGLFCSGSPVPHRADKTQQRMENRLTMLGWPFLRSTAPFLPALTKNLRSMVDGKVEATWHPQVCSRASIHHCPLQLELLQITQDWSL